VSLAIEMDVQGASHSAAQVHLRRGYFAQTHRLCSALVALGMAFDSLVPQFPDSDHLDSTDFRDDRPVTDRSRRYLQERARVLADHGTDMEEYLPGIPTHKLASADGWHVTDKECGQALAAYEAALLDGTAHPADFGEDLIPFLRAAAAAEGFLVH
jgi:hypothetical protein